MRIADRNLIEVLKLLSPTERAAIEDCARAARFASDAAVERLKAATLRRIRFALKRWARPRRK